MFPRLPQAAYPAVLGGVMFSAASMFWIFLGSPERKAVGLNWALLLWAVFPFGALIGHWLPGRVIQRSWWEAGLIGLGVGVVLGFLYTLLAFSGTYFLELWGLFSNRNSGGFASYQASVLRQMKEGGWRMGTAYWPCFAGVVFGFSLHQNRRPFLFSSSGSDSLRLGVDHLKLWVLLSVSVALTACFFQAVVSADAAKILLAGVGILGSSFLGPMLGWMVNPSGGTQFLGIMTMMGAAAIVAFSLFPFFLSSEVQSQTKTALAWVGFITAYFLWLASGLIVTGMSIG